MKCVWLRVYHKRKWDRGNLNETFDAFRDTSVHSVQTVQVTVHEQCFQRVKTQEKSQRK